MTSDESLVERVRRLRWGARACCPRCARARVRLHSGGLPGAKRTYWCLDCGRRFNDLTGLPFARSHVPLETWVACARRLARADRTTCSELARDLGVRLATAWRLRREVGRALADPLLRRILLGEES